MDFILLGIGGALGSVTRFKIGKIIAEKVDTTFPVGTFIINITGAILLGIVSGTNINKNIYTYKKIILFLRNFFFFIKFIIQISRDINIGIFLQKFHNRRN